MLTETAISSFQPSFGLYSECNLFGLENKLLVVLFPIGNAAETIQVVHGQGSKLLVFTQ